MRSQIGLRPLFSSGVSILAEKFSWQVVYSTSPEVTLFEFPRSPTKPHFGPAIYRLKGRDLVSASFIGPEFERLVVDA